MENNKEKKQSKGRRKIEINKISKKSSLNVTFSKRRQGLFNKAGEFCVLSGAEIAIITFSPGGKTFTFGHPSADAILNRYLTGNNTSGESSTNLVEGFWWDEQSIESLDLEELNQYVESMEVLRKLVALKVDEMEKGSD
ncbi:hypothetical protein LWI28_028989 [Acer negundo]|uniref:MADS-box domain-containing protein n=1 Tax=Acer negundo TaxID=4023 RepID=A0AAD5P552_ACENE|nr:hypothetical protein LWI28_028989 [Acer negundo]KAK4858368.1 hypothetical protein QYF36_015330 [Acer negundo]